MPLRRLMLVLLLVVTATSASACGGGEQRVSKQEYGKQVRSVMRELKRTYGSVNDAPPNETTTQTVARLRTTQVALRDAGNQLDEITPPEQLASDHDDLVVSVRDMADAVDLLIEAQQVVKSDPRRAAKLTRQFAADDSFERVADAASNLDAAGVDAGL